MQAESVCQAGKGLGRWKGKAGCKDGKKRQGKKAIKNRPVCFQTGRSMGPSLAKKNALD